VEFVRASELPREATDREVREAVEAVERGDGDV